MDIYLLVQSFSEFDGKLKVGSRNPTVYSIEILLLLQWKCLNWFNGNTVPLSIAGQQCPTPSCQLRQILIDFNGNLLVGSIEILESVLWKT